MRTNLAVEELGTLLEEPLLAVLATLRRDGSVLLSPVWHEWRDGGFNVWVEAENVKVRHLRRDPRATIVVAESEAPLRGLEVRSFHSLLRVQCSIWDTSSASQALLGLSRVEFSRAECSRPDCPGFA